MSLRVPGSRPTVKAVLVLLAVAGVCACSGGGHSSTGAETILHRPAASAGAASDGGAGEVSRRTRTGRRAVGLGGALVVHKAASAAAPVVTRLPAATPLGSPRALLVRQVVPGWVEVLLPVRPNGSSGWVEARSVRVEDTYDLITVDLSARRASVVQGGVQVASSVVAIGSKRAPTPKGLFFVTDRVRPPEPNSTYGAFALGLSGHSPALSEFDHGDGQIGIHGTNVPASIGKAASHGCVRVPADVAAILPGIPLGTPVVIR